MNIDTGNTESFIILHRSHEDFNRTVKTSTAGIDTLNRIVDVPNGDQLLGILIDSSEMPWAKGKIYPNPLEVNKNVKTNFAQMALVQALSYFDWFLINYITNLAQFSKTLQTGVFTHNHSTFYDLTNPPEYSECCVKFSEKYCNKNKLFNRVENICSDIGINDDEINNLLPLFHYFRKARNCIAHSSSRADRTLYNHIISDEFNDSVKYWNDMNSKEAPVLPTPEAGKLIELNFANAIHASAVCYKISVKLNYYAINLLCEDGFLDMAAFYSLLCAEHEFRSGTQKAPESAVNNYLSTRYRIKNINKDDTIQNLKRLSLWSNVVERYKILYP